MDMFFVLIVNVVGCGNDFKIELFAVERKKAKFTRKCLVGIKKRFFGHKKRLCIVTNMIFINGVMFAIFY